MSITVGPYRLSPEFFEKRKLRRHCTDHTCDATCCAEGVYLTIYDARRIVEQGTEIQPYLAEPYDFTQWDLSRPAYIATPVLYADTPREQCWFLMHDKRCAIHKYAVDRGIPVEHLKPYFCRMFPLTLVDIAVNVNEIAVDPKAYKTCLVESDQETWLFEQFETDLRRVIGNELYAQLYTWVR